MTLHSAGRLLLAAFLGLVFAAGCSAGSSETTSTPSADKSAPEATLVPAEVTPEATEPTPTSPPVPTPTATPLPTPTPSPREIASERLLGFVDADSFGWAGWRTSDPALGDTTLHGAGTFVDGRASWTDVPHQLRIIDDQTYLLASDQTQADLLGAATVDAELPSDVWIYTASQPGDLAGREGWTEIPTIEQLRTRVLSLPLLVARYMDKAIDQPLGIAVDIPAADIAELGLFTELQLADTGTDVRVRVDLVELPPSAVSLVVEGISTFGAQGEPALLLYPPDELFIDTPEQAIHWTTALIQTCYVEQADDVWDTVGCDSPHDHQVFAEHRPSLDVSIFDFEVAERRCLEIMSLQRTGAALAPPVESLTFFSPSDAQWDAGARLIECIVTFATPTSGLLTELPPAAD